MSENALIAVIVIGAVFLFAVIRKAIKGDDRGGGISTGDDDYDYDFDDFDSGDDD